MKDKNNKVITSLSPTNREQNIMYKITGRHFGDNKAKNIVRDDLKQYSRMHRLGRRIAGSFK